MSFDAPPAINVPAPPAVVQPGAVSPAPPPVVYVPQSSQPASATSLGGTTGIQTNANSAVNKTEINNRNTVIQNISGSRTTVGSISYERASLYVNASTNLRGDLEFQAGVIVPLGGRGIAKNAGLIAKAQAQASIGQVCRSIRESGFEPELVRQLYPDSPQLVGCVRAKVAESLRSADEELIQLRIELAEMRAKFNQSKRDRATHIPIPAPEPKAVQGLW